MLLGHYISAVNLQFLAYFDRLIYLKCKCYLYKFLIILLLVGEIDIMLQTEILFYKNQLDGTIVLDLRPRLHLGESLVYVNSLWSELTGHYPMNYRPDLSSGTNQPDQGPPIILYSNCCGRLIYLFVPELVQNCPLCGCFIYYLG